MQPADLLILNAAQVVTCGNNGQPKRGRQLDDVRLIENGALAVRAGRIVGVDESAELQAQFQAPVVVNASGKTVIPGLVDCHTHTVYAGNRLAEFEQRIQGRSYMEIMATGGGIASTMRATRAASLNDLIASAEARLNHMLALGTTTVEIKTGYGLDTASEVKQLQAIATLDQRLPQTLVPTFLGAHAVPPEFDSATSYAEYVLADMLPAIASAFQQTHFTRPLFVDVFCEQGVFDRETSQRILQTSRAVWQMQVKAHVDEFVNLGGVAMAVGLGAVSVDHLDVTPLDALTLLANSNTVGVMLPAVNFNLGSSHFGNARALIDAGGILALSTDLNPGSAPTPSLPMVMAIACRYQRLTPAEALNACTINAAAALGLAGELGSLEVGKQADMVLLNTPDYRALAYEFGANLVEQVWIEGAQVWTTS